MPDLIGDLTAELAALKTAISEAYDEVAEAEREWFAKYDDTFEVLREEAQAAGRKSDPAEHAVTSAARRSYPSEYRRWKNAKRDVERLTELAHDTRAEISAHQTRANHAGRLPTVQPTRRAA